MAATDPNMIYLYTDGSSLGNPGPGGYGLIMSWRDHRKEFAGGFRLTTNNRMELLAVIVGLEKITRPGQSVLVVSDSRYVVDSVEKGWVFNWERKQFKKAKNPDLWQRFLAIYRQHRVRFQWVRGHNDHPENERCDRLAVGAAHQPTDIDQWYEVNVARR